MKKRVILVTDGDEYAHKTISYVANEINGRVISQSQGNPTIASGKQLVSWINETPYDPVFVMFDDSGFTGEGHGEKAMKYVAKSPSLNIIGAIAVASNSHYYEWARVDVSIDRFGNLTHYGVDKYGLPDLEIGRISGDTVSILEELNIPFIVGIGDIGKMARQDDVSKGAPITKLAVDLILERSEMNDERRK
jgi:stage V sporulation protein AE